MRVNNGKPYRRKKDFSDLESKPDVLLSLEKLEAVFKKYPSFQSSLFFDAPYKLYEDTKFFTLKFYSSSKGILTCFNYIKLLQSTSPSNQIEFIENSFKFIAEFCIENGILLNQYASFKPLIKPVCFNHLKSHKISWYLVFVIPGLYNQLYDMPDDEFVLYFGDSLNLNDISRELDKDQKTKNRMQEITQRIRKYIENKIKKDK